MNQAPHSLDLFLLLGGMPTRVQALLKTRIHRVEVENTAEMICEYAGDCTGHVYVTTAQAPGSDILMVEGDRATAILDDGRLRVAALPVALRQHLLACSLTGSEDGRLAAEWRDVSCEPDCADMEMAPSVVERFARHIRSGDAQVADGDDGLRQLELTNAAYLSTARRAPVALPVDAAEIEALFDTLIPVSNPDSLRRQAAAEMARLRRH